MTFLQHVSILRHTVCGTTASQNLRMAVTVLQQVSLLRHTLCGTTASQNLRMANGWQLARDEENICPSSLGQLLGKDLVRVSVRPVVRASIRALETVSGPQR